MVYTTHPCTTVFVSPLACSVQWDNMSCAGSTLWKAEAVHLPCWNLFRLVQPIFYVLGSCSVHEYNSWRPHQALTRHGCQLHVLRFHILIHMYKALICTVHMNNMNNMQTSHNANLSWCSADRQHSRISTAFITALNSFLLRNGLDVSSRSSELQQALQPFLLRAWRSSWDQKRKDAKMHSSHA